MTPTPTQTFTATTTPTITRTFTASHTPTRTPRMLGNVNIVNSTNNFQNNTGSFVGQCRDQGKTTSSFALSGDGTQLSTRFVQSLVAVETPLQEVLAIAVDTRSTPIGQSAIEVVTGFAAERGEAERALRYFAAAEANTSTTGIRRDPIDDAFLQPLVARARAALVPAAADASAIGLPAVRANEKQALMIPENVATRMPFPKLNSAIDFFFSSSGISFSLVKPANAAIPMPNKQTATPNNVT